MVRIGQNRRIIDPTMAMDPKSSRIFGSPREARVSLVGAGPGDPMLLTLKARDRLAEAEIVLFDRLVDRRVLSLVSSHTSMVGVGKSPRGPSWRQAAINALMIREARAGKRVVRLKSGDPLLFGRAGEEIAALSAAGITVEIVPGISSAAAAAAAGGFSLTRRRRNRSVTFLTARDADGFAEHDWRHFARNGSALVLFMGVRGAYFVQGRLLMHGASPGTPVTIVENASRPHERIILATLGSLEMTMRAQAVDSPAVIFIGLASDAAHPAIPAFATRRAQGSTP